MDLKAHHHEYLRLFADCVPVKGIRRSAIYDLTRGELYIFPTEYFPVLEWLTTRSVAAVLDELNAAAASQHEGLDRFDEFLAFLVGNELVMFTTDPTRFPSIEFTWDYPGHVQNAILDIDAELYDLHSILGQLDALGCQFLQVRGFSTLLTLDVCSQILAFAANTSLTSVELILKYDATVPDADLVRFMRAEPLVTSLTLHSAPPRASLLVAMAEPQGTDPTSKREVVFTSQVIDSEKHCGLITQDYLNAPSVALYSEFRQFNGCLNRKISVDSSGQIRNCPSMSASFGDVQSTTLAEAVGNSKFRMAWRLAKDQIEVCRGCSSGMSAPTAAPTSNGQTTRTVSPSSAVTILPQASGSPGTGRASRQPFASPMGLDSAMALRSPMISASVREDPAP